MKAISFYYKAFSFLLIILPIFIQAQVGINTSQSQPDTSAMLDIQSAEKGILIPRMTQTQRDAIQNPATSLVIYNTDDSTFNYFSGLTWLETSSLWEQKGDTLFSDEQNKVGIGTATPTEKLSLEGGSFTHSPGAPAQKGAINIPGRSWAIYVAGNYAYVLNEIDGMSILDISDPSAPILLGTILDNNDRALSLPNRIWVAGNYAYVTSEGDHGVEIIDVSDPSNPTHVGVIFDDITTKLYNPYDICVSGKYAYVTCIGYDALEILDISDPANPSHVGSIVNDATTALDAPYSISVVGNYAYIASYRDDGLEILDISDPTNPIHVGAIFDDANTLLFGAYSLDVSGSYAYVSSLDEDGVAVIDISDPANPVQVGSIADDDSTLLEQARTIKVVGNYAYVGSYTENGVEVLDISDPTNPTHVTSIQDSMLSSTFVRTRHIRVQGKNAYVISGTSLNLVTTTMDISGMDAPAAHLGSLSTQNLMVNDNVQIQNKLTVRGGLQVGYGGVYTHGDLSAAGELTMRAGAKEGFIPVADSKGQMTWTDPDSAFSIDNMGDHVARQNLQLGNHWLSEDGDEEGIHITGSGLVGMGTNNPQTQLEIKAVAPEIRLTDGRPNSGNTPGLSLGKMSWYISDTQAPNGYAPAAAIEVVAKNHTAIPDGVIQFHVYNDGGAPVTPLIVHTENYVGVTEVEYPDGSRQTSAPASTGIYVAAAGDFGPAENNHTNEVITAFSGGLGGTYYTSASLHLLAPVHIPHGAVVTKVTVYGYDLHGTNIKTTFYSSDIHAGSQYVISTQTSSTSSGTYTQSETVSKLIDNTLYNYYVRVQLIGGTWHSAGQLAINAVKIEYDMP